MNILTIYHGSNLEIKKPIYHFNNSNIHNDYGLGFYCTRSLDLAKEWANRKTANGLVNSYSFDLRSLKILDLTNKNKYSVLNWIAILIHNREFSIDEKIEFKDAFAYLAKYYIDVNSYDVVIGYRADDAYFRFPLMFIKNVLTLEKLEEIYLNGNLGVQIVLISEKAYDHIKFIKTIESESIYHERFLRRKESADISYRRLELLEKNSIGTRIKDLMRDDI